MIYAPSNFIYRTANDFKAYGIFPQMATTYTKRMLDLEASNPNYKRVNVTVYLAPGDYYLFNCFGKFVEEKACEL